MFAVGDIIYSEDRNCWGESSMYVHFGKVAKVTKTGRFIVDILDNVFDETHEKTKKDKCGRYYNKVVTPSTTIVDRVTLNSDGSIRGKNFGTGLYMKFHKYTNDLILVEDIDMGGQ